jgi:hypothetical protein
MQDGSNKQIKLLIKTLSGNSYTVEANSNDTCLSLKEKLADLIDESPQQYHGLEYYTSYSESPDSLILRFVGKDLENDQLLDQYGLQNGSTIQYVPRCSNRSYHIKIMCIANNVKFTTFIKHSYSKPCTVGELKAKLSQFTSLACTALHLKKRGVDEFCTLENNDAAVPLKDIYAILDGEIAITPRTNALHLYSTDDGRIVSDCNYRAEKREENGDQKDLTRSFFSLPEPESIVKLEPEHRQALIKCVGAVNAPSLKKETSNKYSFSNTIIYAACGGGVILLGQFLPPNNSSDRNLFTVASITLIGAVAGVIIGTASNYVYERCFKSQNNTYELSNSR